MSDQPSVEERLTNLEKAVGDLQARFHTRTVAADWLEKVKGSISDDEAFQQVLEYGRQFRQADRPDDNEF